MKSEEVTLLGSDEYHSSKYLGDLGDIPGISNDEDRLQARTERIRIQKYKGKVVTTALNALPQLFWLHLCREDL